MYKRILVPLDGSLMAEIALPHAIALAEIFQSELVLLRVLIPISRPPTKAEAALRRAEEASAALAREYLERVAADAEKRGITVKKITIEGPPHSRILKYAENNHVDLIVMCARGQSGVSRWLMGSVSDRVVRGVRVPVLLVRTRSEETKES